MADEAQRLDQSLDDAQRKMALFPFPADDERRRWYYTPTDHGGLTLAAMTQPQHRMVFRLAASALSTPAYVTMSTIIGLENVLDQLDGFTASFERPRGRDPLMYFVRFFGTPSPTGTWSWRLGGHHVSLNFTIIDGVLSGSTPLFFGADPASSPLLGPHPLRPLAGVEDLARELVRSLPDDQRGLVVVSPHAPTDLVGANRPSLSEGDQPLALRQVWRKQFDGDQGDALHLPSIISTSRPSTRLTSGVSFRNDKGLPPRPWAARTARCSTRCCVSTSTACPTMSPTKKPQSSPGRRSTMYTFCGPGR
jgi:hypothetical protein